jgi:hypothetical protein
MAENSSSPDAASPTCRLGRPLGDCALRRAGCGSLYEVLAFVMPPMVLVAELRRRQDLPVEVRHWLVRLAEVGV